MMKTTFHAASAAILAFAAVALASATARAGEELVQIRPGDEIGLPKSLNARVGGEGGLPCVAIQVPHSGGGYVSVSCGASHKVANEDAITTLQESSAKLGDMLVRFRVGDATFYGFYCKECGGYEGHAVAMGGFMALYVFPPKDVLSTPRRLKSSRRWCSFPRRASASTAQSGYTARRAR